MAEINLLPVEEKASESLTNSQKKVTFVSFGVLIVTAVATVAILILFTIYAGQRNKLLEANAQFTGKIESLKNVEELLTVASKKVTTGEKVLSTRLEYTDFFNNFSALVPQGVYFSSIKITGSKISISGKAKTSADVAGFVSQLVSNSGSKLVSGAIIDSLNSDEKGVYTFSMTAEFTQKKGGSQ